MDIRIIAVGNLKEDYLLKAQEETLGFFKGKTEFSVIEVKEEKAGQNPSEKETAKILEMEGKRILKAIPERSYVAVMDINGKRTDEKSFSKSFDKAEYNGSEHFVVIIGGSWGLSEEVKKYADERISFSALTFPHQLFRMAVMESISKILRNRKK